MNRVRDLVAGHSYLAFVLMNLVLVWGSLAILLGGKSVGPYVVAAGLILVEAPQFFRAATRWRRALVLYLAFIVFAWSFTLFDLSSHISEIHGLGDAPGWIAGMVARGLFFVLMGHVYGLPFMPIVIAANLLVFRNESSRAPVRASLSGA